MSALAPCRHHCSLGRVLLALCLAASMSFARAALPVAADDFEDLAPWRADAADGVGARLRAVPGADGSALRLDYDFAGAGGYAFVRRELPTELPENFEITFRVRGSALRNHFEIKLVDASGDNVWWHARRDHAFAGEWQTWRIKRRQIDFAWGPAADRTLRRFQRIEFVVAAGRDGGAGHVEIDSLRIDQVPVPRTAHAPPRASASSAQAGGEASRAVDGDPATAWRAERHAQPVLHVDLGEIREFGGLRLKWLPGAHATRYDIDLSLDGREWQRAQVVDDANGGDDNLLLTDAEARYVRLSIRHGVGNTVALGEITLRDLASGENPNAFFRALAAEAPRGTYPRGFSGEQSYWTILGTVDGGDSGLLSEDGAVEPAPGQFALEPFVEIAGRMHGWADAAVSHSLLDDDLPVPSVHWRLPAATLTVTAFAIPGGVSPTIWMRYRLHNTQATPQRMRLLLAARPFQAYPPTQFLNTAGGIAALRDLRWNGQSLAVNGEFAVVPLTPPSHVDIGSYPAREAVVAPLAAVGAGPVRRSVVDASGMATATLTYPLTLGPNEQLDVVVVMAPASVAPGLAGEGPGAFEPNLRKVARDWRGLLDRVQFDLPAAGQPLAAAVRSSLAWMRMMRRGPALQPGTRSYDRSWIRDGAMIAEGFLRLGERALVADYLRWYLPYQYPNGKVPCCVDRRGADPVPENDSHGQLVFLAAEYYRYSGDRLLLERAWPHVAHSVDYMDSLRRSERRGTPANDAERALYGLMPASISHEGYSAKAMHSYWDDFWALRGYKDAVFIAEMLGKADEAKRWRASRDEFRSDLLASLAAAQRWHGVAFLPGAAELGDFDASSTTIALAPGGEQANLPRAALEATFERYWQDLAGRRDGTRPWSDYAPYEWRIVGTMVRLGWRERAWSVFEFLFADRRPQAWNQWPEVVGREARLPRFIGDLPHGWVASDFVRSALDLFAFEREDEQALVLAGGIPLAWLEGKGIGVRRLGTRYGPLGYRLSRQAGEWTLSLDGGAQPPGGFRFEWPLDGEPPPARIDGKPAVWQGRTLTIPPRAARVVVGSRT